MYLNHCQQSTKPLIVSQCLMHIDFGGKYPPSTALRRICWRVLVLSLGAPGERCCRLFSCVLAGLGARPARVTLGKDTRLSLWASLWPAGSSSGGSCSSAMVLALRSWPARSWRPRSSVKRVPDVDGA